MTHLDLTYDALGNITYKSDVGTYTYDTAKKHRLTGVTGGYTFAYDAYSAEVGRSFRRKPVTLQCQHRSKHSHGKSERGILSLRARNGAGESFR